MHLHHVPLHRGQPGTPDTARGQRAGRFRGQRAGWRLQADPSGFCPLFLGPLLRGNLLLVGAQLSWRELQPHCLCKISQAFLDPGKSSQPGSVWAVVSLGAARQAVRALQGV